MALYAVEPSACVATKFGKLLHCNEPDAAKRNTCPVKQLGSAAAAVVHAQALPFHFGL